MSISGGTTNGHSFARESPHFFATGTMQRRQIAKKRHHDRFEHRCTRQPCDREHRGGELAQRGSEQPRIRASWASKIARVNDNDHERKHDKRHRELAEHRDDDHQTAGLI